MAISPSDNAAQAHDVADSYGNTVDAPTYDDATAEPEVTGVFKHIAKVIPYFRNPRHVLVFKLDVFLLAWMFLAGIMKEMDQSATTQAYVSGMRESLSLYGNELVLFNTFFSIGYAIGLVPGQLIQTRLRPSLFLPFCEMAWGFFVLFTYKAKSAETVYALRFFLGLLSAAFWPSVVALIFNWYTPRELAVRLAVFTVSDVAGAIPAITRALWLSPAERVLARDRMASFGAKTSSMLRPAALRRKLRQIVVHPVTYFFLFAFALNAWAHRANAYFVLYLESLTNADGSSRPSASTPSPTGSTGAGRSASAAPPFHGLFLAVLCAWPPDDRVVLSFYFLTYATNAGSSSLMAWFAEILRREPEARAIIVAATVTIVYVGHATIPLRAWRVADAPRYPVGFPLVTAFTGLTVLVQLGLLFWERRHPEIVEYGYEKGPAGSVAGSDEEGGRVDGKLSPEVVSEAARLVLLCKRFSLLVQIVSSLSLPKTQIPWCYVGGITLGST
ncbi:pantothenate transporter FEN2 [Verticillium dahliae VdLs.17]|uniref:Pantothenate transporter FEN2 n=1 Tax=Verticillium dahliae (strain VdLs.17 / ATCC MYA-4575 / FGSC 10137) TaxID=498257 RepID=G2XD26_VERDV|nr:pantothenate transporter FEN2 [Verticillium dahliae VdLs.17]EGY16894.1 pantothenate transporter FEN2 [Verticillium dahliae VdLs.17]